MMIAAGGTGGHVYPALAAAEAVRRQAPSAEITFVGSVGDFARPLLEEARFPFTYYDEVRAGPLHGVSPTVMIRSAIQLALGTVQAWRLVGARKPDVMLLTGGWVGLPAALAARVRGVPALIYLPDIEPGLAIKQLTPLVRQVAVTTPDSRRFFPTGKTVVTGYPIRDDVRAATREAAVAHFNLDPARKTLLVFGGSRGARSINHAIIDIVPQLLASLPLQIIHVTGTLDAEDMAARRDRLTDTAHYHLFPYLHDDMGLAFAVADLVVCRSGASTLGELPYFGLPSVLIPYPYAWRYQKVNADWLAERGAAIVMRDEDMPRDLLTILRDLLTDEARLNTMQTAARALARPDGAASDDGAANLATALLHLAT